MNRVLVVDTNHRPLDPIRPAEARLLLSGQKAAVLRMSPFTIILKDESHEEAKPLRVAVDPGSRVTGMALVDEEKNEVVFAMEIEHRGHIVKKALDSRRAIRRSRRNRKCRHRQPRFLNRTKPKGWLAPSIMSRIYDIETWVRRLSRWSPVTSISVESVKFDTQQMENPDISGVEYQRGTLFGFEVWEYLLEKWGRKCAYCGQTDVKLEKEHIIPKSRGGSNRVSNLTVSCRECNQDKGTMTAEEFGHPRVQAEAKRSLRDAAAVNIGRKELVRRLEMTGLPVEMGTGGQTKFNRTSSGFPKAHWIDAACVGSSGAKVRLDPRQNILGVKAMGWGSRQMCHVDKFGFPRTGPKGSRVVHGFQTGDIVKAVVSSGKFRGTHVGRVAVRTSGSFTLGDGVTTSWKNCLMVQKMDGYAHFTNRTV